MVRGWADYKVSLRFCVAAALPHGRLIYREFSENALADPALQH